MAYLDDHPPARTQMRCPRRAKPSGVIVVHTAESMLDLSGPDTGAEGVARFIAGRTDAAGSYHELCDSDSTVQVVRWTCEAFHDGTGTNPHSMGLSFALRAADWPSMDPARTDRFLRNGAGRAAAYAAWVKAEHGITIPARRVSRDASTARTPGFISHGERDPGRRTDPGAGFPWTRFLQLYAEAAGGQLPIPPPPNQGADVKDHIIFFAADGGGNHAYRCTGHLGHYLDKPSLDAARFLGVPLANDPAKPWPANTRGAYRLEDGPLRNV